MFEMRHTNISNSDEIISAIGGKKNSHGLTRIIVETNRRQKTGANHKTVIR